jgi:hypothetical protein
LPYSQKPTLNHLNGILISISCIYLLFILILSSHLRLYIPSDLFPWGFWLSTVCIAHLSPAFYILHYFILLVLITQIMFDEEYKLWMSLLSSVLHPVTYSLLEPNIHLFLFIYSFIHLLLLLLLLFLFLLEHHRQFVLSLMSGSVNSMYI